MEEFNTASIAARCAAISFGFKGSLALGLRLQTLDDHRHQVTGFVYSLCATELQARDKAIADRELRRMASLREIYRRDGFLARRLEQASQEIIDGEFSEAAE